MGEVLWELRGVTVDGRAAARLGGVTLTIERGVTAVVGSSGAGKTTLLNLLVGFERAQRGSVEARLLKGERLPVFWAPPDGGLWPHLTVREHLEAVCPERENASVDGMLREFELGHCASAKPGTLSAGERARVAVARALAARAVVLVMDEPLAHVEPALARRLWGVIRRHVEETGASLVFSTHVPETVLRHAERVVLLAGGQVVADGAVETLYWDPPTRRAMEMLGEGNWLEPPEAEKWLRRRVEKPAALRPERVELADSEEGVLRVEASRVAGPVAESVLSHEPTGERRAFVHRPRFPAAPAGRRVALRVLAVLVLMLAVVGCGRGVERELAVREVRHWVVPPAEGRVPSPRSVSIGPGDEVVALDNGGRVLVYDESGAIVRQWSMPTNENGNPEGSCWLKDGRIAVADTHYHRIVFFDAEGNVLSMMGRRGIGPGEFEYPVSIVQDEAGFVYVAEYGGNDRVQKFTAGGEFVLSFGRVGTGPGEFQRCSGMAWRDGKLYVADASNGRVQVFDEHGKLLHVLGGSDALRFRFPYDVEAAADGTVYVIEWGAGRVTRVTDEGEVIGSFGHPGSGKGELRTPWSVAVDSKGRVRIADTENRRIVELIL